MAEHPPLTASTLASLRNTRGYIHEDYMEALVDEIIRLRARVAELERRKPAESKFPNASGFPDP